MGVRDSGNHPQITTPFTPIALSVLTLGGARLSSGALVAVCVYLSSARQFFSSLFDWTDFSPSASAQLFFQNMLPPPVLHCPEGFHIEP